MTRQYTEADCDHARHAILNTFDIKAVKVELVRDGRGPGNALFAEGLTIGNGRLLASPFAEGEPHEIVDHLLRQGWPRQFSVMPARKETPQERQAREAEEAKKMQQEGHQAIMEAEAAFASYASDEKTSGK